MLINGPRLLGCPILSLHVGGKIATVTELIIDPDSLKLIACRVDGPLVGGDVGDILLMDDVREFSRMGMIVDSTDVFAEADDVIRVQEVQKLRFRLLGIKVETRQKAKLGKVSDFILDSATWRIHQLVIQRPMLKSLIDPELLISRQEVVKVTDYKIVVKDEEKTLKQQAEKAAITTNFVNPFRQQNTPAAEPSEISMDPKA